MLAKCKVECVSMDTEDRGPVPGEELGSFHTRSVSAQYLFSLFGDTLIGRCFALSFSAMLQR